MDARRQNQGVPLLFLVWNMWDMRPFCPEVRPKDHHAGPRRTLRSSLPGGKETGQCYLFQTAGFFLLVLFHKLFQRVFQSWERCNGPVERRDVDLVNSFGVRGR